MSAFPAPVPRSAPWHGPLALCAGLAQAASLALPGSGQPVWWLQLASMAVLAALLRSSPTWRRAAALGGLFATAWLAGTFWWLFISMHTYGGLSAPLAVAAVLALAAFLGSYYAAVLGIFKALEPSGRAQAAIVFGALWMLAELARGVWWTGFPWGAGGGAGGGGGGVGGGGGPRGAAGAAGGGGGGRGRWPLWVPVPPGSATV